MWPTSLAVIALATALEAGIGLPGLAVRPHPPSDRLDRRADRLARPRRQSRNATPRRPPRRRHPCHLHPAARHNHPRLADPGGAVAPANLAVLAAARRHRRRVPRPAQPVHPCDGGRRRPASRRAGRGADRGVAYRRPQPAAPRHRGVLRAAIESLAENFADGVVAPVVWGVLAGLPGTRRLQGDQHRRQHAGPSHAAASAIRLGGGAAGRSGQSAGLPPCGPAADRRGLVPSGRIGARRRPRRAARRRRPSLAPMPAGRRRRWRARSACAWPARASMATPWWRMPGWATAVPKPVPPDLDRALALYRLACALEIAALVAAALTLHSAAI